MSVMLDRRVVLAGGWALLVGSTLGPAARAQTSPQLAADFVQQLANQAIATLRAPGTTIEQREVALRRLLRQGFDLQLIGRFVLGRYYRSATPEQRADFQALFEEYLLRTYSSRLGGYSGESFTIVSAVPAGTKDALIRTRIDRPSGPPLHADWRVRATGNQNRIIDVMVEGVSMAVTQRSEFAAVISRGGFDGLLVALRARVQKYSVASS